LIRSLHWEQPPNQQRLSVVALGLFLAGVGLLAACQAPIHATKAPPSRVYRQLQENALGEERPSGATRSILRRFDQLSVFEQEPDSVLLLLHQKAVASADRELLFALSELSYLTGNALRHSVKPWELRNPRDYYLAAAVYAWFFLFGEAKDPPPSAFDPRFRIACDLYNRGLGGALIRPGSTNAEVQFPDGLRQLPTGRLQVNFDPARFRLPLSDVARFVLADSYLIQGFSVRNRQPGIGTPLVAVTPPLNATPFSRASPATAVLRLNGDLHDFQRGACTASLELYSTFDDTTITINRQTVPLETDTTTAIAYSLNQAPLWKLGYAQFLSSVEKLPSDVYQTRPYQPGKVPVVFVHGTFSSPVWWAEMINTLTADPLVQKKYQFWWFVYNSGNPTVYSANKLRRALTEKVHELDPSGRDPALRQMVVIGHSQGGLLTKLTATDTEDRLWRALSTNRLERLDLNPEEQRLVQEYLFYKPLPFVKRVVFITTPHRGSFQAGDIVRKLARRVVSLPNTLLRQQKTLAGLASRIRGSDRVDRSIRTSLDSMSTDNRGLLALAEIPLAPGIKGHSIIAIKGNGDYLKGDDGVVSYSSAHVDYVESEYIARGPHSCLAQPDTIEEVRRILHLHVGQLVSHSTNSLASGKELQDLFNK
jgi:pimeloyl-ACP methyl ester carboxylesterase